MANGSPRRALPHLLPQLLPSHPTSLLTDLSGALPSNQSPSLRPFRGTERHPLTHPRHTQKQDKSHNEVLQGRGPSSFSVLAVSNSSKLDARFWLLQCNLTCLTPLIRGRIAMEEALIVCRLVKVRPRLSVARAVPTGPANLSSSRFPCVLLLLTLTRVWSIPECTASPQTPGV